MKKLANLKGVKTLNRNEQKAINGGKSGGCCNPADDCCAYVGGSGCQYIYADPNFPGYPYWNFCV